MLAFSLAGTLQLMAQSEIHGTVADAGGKPIKDASVLLLKSSDSSLVKGMVSDAAGKYTFENINKGSYLVSASFSGMPQVYTKVFELTQDNIKKNLGTISLESADVQLKSVTVIAKKPLFEQKIDRMVINVANSITSAGSTVLEVLERSPGIIVDRQNNTISMNGKNGIVVMINGRISHMPIEALVQLLSGMNSDNVERIELITTPPANLDAEGNAGYINIVLKKNNSYGTNGSYSLTGGYNKGGALTGASINFNHRNGKVNFYGDYTFLDNRSCQLFSFYHKVTYQNTVTENNSDAHRHIETFNQNARLGLDYQVSKKTVIGVSDNYLQ